MEGPGPAPGRPSSLSPSPAHTPCSLSPSRSRRQSDAEMGGAAAAASTVVLFPGSGTLAAASVGAMGSIAAVATGGIALLGAGAVACAFKFSPSMNNESSGLSRKEQLAQLDAANKTAEEGRQEVLRNQAKSRALGQDDCLATVLSARDHHR